MQRLGRRSAGRQVAARSARLSSDLLALEDACFDQIDIAFAVLVSEAGTAYGRAWGRASEVSPPRLADARLPAALISLQAAALEKTRAPVAALAGQVRDSALESIEDELVVCENTLSARYAGTAVQAARKARDRSEVLVTERLMDYEFALARGGQAFAQQLAEQMGLSAMYGEDQTRGALRLFNVEPNRLPGNGGRGVWWRASSGLQAAARDVSIRLAGTVRLAAMEEFNAA